MRLLLLLAVAICFSVPASVPASAAFPCKSSDAECQNLWVAAQDLGSPETFFEANGKDVRPADSRTNDRLTANRQINVRIGAANWQKPVFVLKKGDSIVAAELRTIRTESGKTQLWLRIVEPQSESKSNQPATPVAEKPVNTCMQLPTADKAEPVPIITPKIGSAPPSPADLARLLEGRDIYCDQYGLIVHRHADGTFDGGDTAQREGWYWLGVWLRTNIPGLPKWNHPRQLNFDQVLALLEPDRNGLFYRHPKQPPFSNPRDKEFGFSRDQMVPLVAAMGVWGKHDAIRRLWEALPEDGFTKHSFNGNWRNFLGQDGPNCTDIKARSCDPAQDGSGAVASTLPDHQTAL